MEAERAKNCTVLYIDGGRPAGGLAAALRSLGLTVHECSDWPDDESALMKSEAVIVHVTSQNAARMAMRLRAKRRFGRRVLIGLAPAGMTRADRQESRDAGFDAICDENIEGRTLLAIILRALRDRPEFTCRIPRRSAA
jgi:hypothetical protein